MSIYHVILIIGGALVGSIVAGLVIAFVEKTNNDT